MSSGNGWRSIAWTAVPGIRFVEDSQLRAEWDRLNDARGSAVTLASPVVAAALEVFGRARELLLVGRDGPRIVAMLILEPAGAARWQTFQPSQLPLGPWVAESCLYPGDLAQSVLRSGVLGLALVVGVTQIDPRISPRRPDGALHFSMDYVETAWIDIVGSFGDYWAKRSKNLRNVHRRQRMQLAEQGIHVGLQRVEDPAEVDRAVLRFAELEARGWKGRAGTAVAPGNAQETFYRKALTALAARGEASVWEYRFDDALVASNLTVSRGDELVVLKTSYDETWRRVSPAFLLREDQLRQLASENGPHRLEFYGRVREWQRRWAERSVVLYHVTAFRWSILKQLARQVGDRRRRRSQADAEDSQAHLAG